MLAIDTRPFCRRPDGVTGVTGVRPPLEEVRETFPGVPGVRTSLELLPGVPGVRGVRAGVPGRSPDPPFDLWSIFDRTFYCDRFGKTVRESSLGALQFVEQIKS